MNLNFNHFNREYESNISPENLILNMKSIKLRFTTNSLTEENLDELFKVGLMFTTPFAGVFKKFNFYAESLVDNYELYCTCVSIWRDCIRLYSNFEIYEKFKSYFITELEYYESIIRPNVITS